MKNYLSLLLLISCVSLPLQNFAQTETPPVYSPDGQVKSLISKGDTLIVGGRFNHVGRYTGGGALFTTISDQPNLIMPKFIGEIYACTSDNNGGYYIYGDYYRETELSTSKKGRIEHILPDNSFDTGFSLPVFTQSFPLNHLLYNNGILYIAGYGVNKIGNDSVGDLSAYNVTNKQFLNTIPSIKYNGAREYYTGVKKMLISNNSLYLIGKFNEIGGVQRNGGASISITNNTINSWNPTPNWANFTAYNDIKAYNNKIILGGEFNDAQFPNPERHSCAILDNQTGQTFNYIFRTDNSPGNGYSYLHFQASVSALAISGDILYTYSVKSSCGDTRVTAINLATIPSNNTLWTRHFDCIASCNTTMEVINNSVFVVGSNFDNIYNQSYLTQSDTIERQIKGGVKLNATNGILENWFPNPVGNIYNDVKCITLYANNIFLGGKFSHVNGIDRKGVYMTNAQSETILPFNINDSFNNANVYALKLINDTLYVAGSLQNIRNRFLSVNGYNINSGNIINWSPPEFGTAYSIEANDNYVFLGGQLTEPAGGLNRTGLFAINRQTASLTNWSPNPSNTVSTLKIVNDKLFAGGSFNNISGESRNRLASFDLSSLNLSTWNPGSSGVINTINTTDNTIWVGGNFFQVAGVNRRLFAGLQTQNGTIRYSPFINGTANAIQSKGIYLFVAGDFIANNTESCNSILAYDLFNKIVLPGSSFCLNINDLSANVNSLGFTKNDLFFGGDFIKVNGKANATYIGRIKFDDDFFKPGGEYISVQNGNWNVASTWEKNEVPPASARVIVRHNVVITQNASCYSLLVEKPSGDLNVNIGIELKILSEY